MNTFAAKLFCYIMYIGIRINSYNTYINRFVSDLSTWRPTVNCLQIKYSGVVFGNQVPVSNMKENDFIAEFINGIAS